MYEFSQNQGAGNDVHVTEEVRRCSVCRRDRGTVRDCLQQRQEHPGRLRRQHAGGRHGLDDPDGHDLDDHGDHGVGERGLDAVRRGVLRGPGLGRGSFDGMSTAPVATAASNNPVLSTLVTAVKTAGLVDTLNTAQGITVFAPANSAFAKVPEATLNGLLADKPTLNQGPDLPRGGGPAVPDQLAGAHKTLEGGSLTVTGSGQTLQVNNANVSAATCRPPTPPCTSSTRC